MRRVDLNLPQASAHCAQRIIHADTCLRRCGYAASLGGERRRFPLAANTADARSKHRPDITSDQMITFVINVT
jgi:hypothetical protein